MNGSQLHEFGLKSKRAGEPKPEFRPQFETLETRVVMSASHVIVAHAPVVAFDAVHAAEHHTVKARTANAAENAAIGVIKLAVATTTEMLQLQDRLAVIARKMQKTSFAARPALVKLATRYIDAFIKLETRHASSYVLLARKAVHSSRFKIVANMFLKLNRDARLVKPALVKSFQGLLNATTSPRLRLRAEPLAPAQSGVRKLDASSDANEIGEPVMNGLVARMGANLHKIAMKLRVYAVAMVLSGDRAFEVAIQAKFLNRIANVLNSYRSAFEAMRPFVSTTLENGFVTQFNNMVNGFNRLSAAETRYQNDNPVIHHGDHTS